jgi:hypothetical protein
MANKIFYQLYNPTGMINQVMSVELAVGLAHETNKEMIVHYISNNGDQLYNFNTVPIYTPSRWSNDQRKDFVNHDQFPHITDILNWNTDMLLIDEKINNFKQQSTVIDDMTFRYYFSKEDSISENELMFAEGRQRLDIQDNIHVKNTLGWYSRFFYNRSKELDSALKSVDFKQEYYDFANMICDSIGSFQGAHLRLSDHVRMFNTTEEMFEQTLLDLEKNGLPIVLSTDEPSHSMVLKNKHRVIMLDEYIVNNFEKEFKSLKFQDEVIFGLICNLVMHKAKYFVGTSGSTYTAYIHRKRLQNGLEEPFDFFDKPNKTHSGPYSWNNYDLDNGKKMWWREWKESLLL